MSQPFLLMSFPKSPLLRHTGLRTGMSLFVRRKPRKLTTTLSSTCSNNFWLEPWSLHRAYTTGPKPTIASARSAGGVPPAIMMPLGERHQLSWSQHLGAGKSQAHKQLSVRLCEPAKAASMRIDGHKQGESPKNMDDDLLIHHERYLWDF